MPIVLKVLFLAVIQGITEFLPISSSGHLAIAGHFLGFEAEENVRLSLVLHAGSLVSIAVYYRREIWRIVREFDWRLALMLGVATVPVVVVGLGVKFTGVEERLVSIWTACGGLLLTAAFLRFLHRPEPSGRPLSQVGLKNAVVIGLLQSVAILPGVSRSGSTISAGTRVGLAREDAATFSFLIGMIAIGGAIVLKAKDLLDASQAPEASLGLGVLAMGFVVSAGVGYLALAVLIRTLKRGKFSLFSYYCLAVALLALVAALIKG